jgi:hypothetical protein
MHTPLPRWVNRVIMGAPADVDYCPDSERAGYLPSRSRRAIHVVFALRKKAALNVNTRSRARKGSIARRRCFAKDIFIPSVTEKSGSLDLRFCHHLPSNWNESRKAAEIAVLS